MNLDRYEKIDGREALRRLVDGQKVYDNYGWYWEMSKDGIVSYVKDEKKFLSEIHLATFSTHKYLYIPKPFDVRQAMFERPNEWVGKFPVEYEDETVWYYVGFDSKNYCALQMKKRRKHGMKEPVMWNGGNVLYAISEDLDRCIPIEDVPEEATR